jgi:hypothetical protein
MAEDYARLHFIISAQAAPGVQLWGPDSTDFGHGSWLGQFLANLTDVTRGHASESMQASTVHQYYGGANESNLTQAISADTLDSLRGFASSVRSTAASTGYTGALIAGETSSFWSGGIPGVSDRFAAGFTWLDKLGVLAEAGFERVFRQTFVGGVVPPFNLNYALVAQDLTPHPGTAHTHASKNSVRNSLCAQKAAGLMRLLCLLSASRCVCDCSQTTSPACCSSAWWARSCCR